MKSVYYNHMTKIRQDGIWSYKDRKIRDRKIKRIIDLWMRNNSKNNTIELWKIS